MDLSPTALRGRHLSLIVWATTIGVVAGPQFAALAAACLLLLLRPDPAAWPI